MEAGSIDDCVGRLEARGLLPISVEEQSLSGAPSGGAFSERVGERPYSVEAGGRTAKPQNNHII